MSDGSDYWRSDEPLQPMPQSASESPDPDDDRPGSRAGLFAALIAGAVALALLIGGVLMMLRPDDSTITGSDTGSDGVTEGARASGTAAPGTDPNLPGGTLSAGPAVAPPSDYTPTEGPSARDQATGSSASTPTGSGSGSTGVDGQQVDVYSLQVGDCMLDPGENSTVKTVTKVGCQRSHTAEVYAALTLAGKAYPGADTARSEADAACGEAFTKFVGRPVTDSTLSYTFLLPTRETWGQGDRAVTCMVYDPDRTITGSMKGTDR